jgi:hypothetical protein
MTFNPNSSALKERYMQLFEVGDFRSLPKQEIANLAFGIPEFWTNRARFLAVDSEAELLRNTPLEGAHSLPGTPAYRRRVNGG